MNAVVLTTEEEGVALGCGACSVSAAVYLLIAKASSVGQLCEYCFLLLHSCFPFRFSNL